MEFWVIFIGINFMLFQFWGKFSINYNYSFNNNFSNLKQMKKLESEHNAQDSQLQQGQFSEQQKQEDQASSQFIKPTKAGRKNLCDVCVKSLAKYTCPGCGRKSCNIQCINKHKIDNDCTGKPDTTGYVQKGAIDEGVVRKDFQYVKSMLEETDKIKKTLTGVTSHIQEPKRFYFLRKQARIEHNIKVHQAPPMIERHRQNISFYYMKTKTIYWVIEILYYKGNRKFSRTLLEPQPDTKTLQQILPTDFLCQQLLLKQINTTKNQQFDIFIQNRQTVITNTTTYEEQDKNKQKHEEQRRENKIIIEVQRQSKMVDVLKNMNVYEFPTFILVHRSLRKMFCKWKKIN